MANLVQSFLRNRSSIRTISKLAPPFISHQRSTIGNFDSLFQEDDPLSVSNHVVMVTGKKSDEPLRFYPSFPFGYCMNLVSMHESRQIETASLAETAVEEEEGQKDEKDVVIYADSVKRKRKKKMNKHKYRKLRKRLQRKT